MAPVKGQIVCLNGGASYKKVHLGLFLQVFDLQVYATSRGRAILPVPRHGCHETYIYYVA